MKRSRRSLHASVAALALTFVVTSLHTDATATSSWSGVSEQWAPRARAAVPEDRYAMAGGCYSMRAPGGGFVSRSEASFAATAAEEGAEPLRFQATDLGKYLLFGTAQDFLAASEGVAGQAAYAVTRSTPGAVAGGVALEQTDQAADALARSEVNEAAGRGARVIAAAQPSELADWTLEGTAGEFTLRLEATGQWLAVDGRGTLVLSAEQGTPFALAVTSGCAAFPEIDLNITGPILRGATQHQEVRGYLDAHLHMMAFEFLGGRVRCGRPWHPYGVTHALVDCPDHEPEGEGAALEMALSGEPGRRHDTDGWPTFAGWPRHKSLTHEQIYYRWLERAWRGGLRMFVNLLVDNNQLCKVYPYKRNSCNEMENVLLQRQRIDELIRYIDAQNGGPGRGWMRIVTDPFEARRVINQGRLAVVLGIEVSVPLDCGITLDLPRCNEDELSERLRAVHEMGVRQMELVNKFDNALSGVTGDAGTTGIVVNQGNLGETGRYWRMETCARDEHAHDKTQMNFHDESGAPDEFSGRDSLVGGILAMFGKSGAAPVYPEGPHCNTLGLSDLGKRMIEEMVDLKMIFDPDHMSARARTKALDLLETLGYSGVVSSHGWADNTIYPRIYKLGGVVTPHAGGSTGFLAKWRQHKQWQDERFFFGIGYGADTNGFSTQGGPRGANAANAVTYPFTGFGGVQVDKQVSGTRAPYDINLDGVAHYGLYPDWIEDVRRQAGDDGPAFMEHMARGPEAYLQMWERALGIRGDACRADVADLTDADLDGVIGMTDRQLLETLGQPNERGASAFTFCLTGDRKATVSLTPEGVVDGLSIA